MSAPLAINCSELGASLAEADSAGGTERPEIDFSRIKLHLGAFNCSVPDWVNTDVTPHIWIAKLPLAAWVLRRCGKMTAERYEEHRRGVFRNLKFMDLTKPLPFEDGSVSAVFSSHVFEHLFPDEVGRLISEIHRVLVPGGICRVVVPDLEKIMLLYDVDNPRAFLEAIYEIGRRSDVKNAHHGGFTGRSLQNSFRSAGFSRSYVTEYRKGVCPDVVKLDNRPTSIFFEALK